MHKQLQNSHGDVNYGIGNGVAEELKCITHGREQCIVLCSMYCLREWVILDGEGQKGYNQDNCNIIMNKI